MGLDEIRGLDSDRCVHCLCVWASSSGAICVCGHFQHLKQVDFDLHAHLYCAQLMEDRNLLLPRWDSQRLAGRQPHQCGHETCFHLFHSYPECGREPCSHPFHWYLYPQYVFSSCGRPNMSISVVSSGSSDPSSCTPLSNITSD